MNQQDYLPRRCVYCGDTYYHKRPLILVKRSGIKMNKIKKYRGLRTCSRLCSRALAKLEYRLKRRVNHDINRC